MDTESSIKSLAWEGTVTAASKELSPASVTSVSNRVLVTAPITATRTVSVVLELFWTIPATAPTAPTSPATEMVSSEVMALSVTARATAVQIPAVPVATYASGTGAPARVISATVPATVTAKVCETQRL